VCRVNNGINQWERRNINPRVIRHSLTARNAHLIYDGQPLLRLRWLWQWRDERWRIWRETYAKNKPRSPKRGNVWNWIKIIRIPSHFKQIETKPEREGFKWRQIARETRDKVIGRKEGGRYWDESRKWIKVDRIVG